MSNFSIRELRPSHRPTNVCNFGVPMNSNIFAPPPPRHRPTDRSRGDISRSAALSAAFAFDEEESMTPEDNIHARAGEAARADLHGASIRVHTSKRS